MRNVILICLALSAAAGCTPGVWVKKNPGFLNRGVRYYRPKPYLLVSAADTEQVTKLDDKGKPSEITSKATDQFVTLQLQYLPDFSEEYAITVTPGIGTAEVELKLENGWNLTSINQTLDSKLPENIESVSKLVSAIGSIVPTSKRDAGTSPPTDTSIHCAARNVPLGYYESVIGRDPCGRKQLYGWRYVGFAPFNACPLAAQGMEGVSCNNGSLQVYALVFENNVMIFKPLHEVAAIPPAVASYMPPRIAGADKPDSASAPKPAAGNVDVAKLKLDIITRAKNEAHLDVSVCIEPAGVRVQLIKGLTPDMSRDKAFAKLRDIAAEVTGRPGSDISVLDERSMPLSAPPAETIPKPEDGALHGATDAPLIIPVPRPGLDGS